MSLSYRDFHIESHSKNFLFTSVHTFCPCLGFVLISQQVQHAMHGQEGQFGVQRQIVLGGLSCCRIDRDHHISQEGGHPRDYGRLGCIGQKIVESEGEDIGWFVHAPVLAIHGMYGGVIGQKDAYLRAGVAFRLQ